MQFTFPTSKAEMFSALQDIYNFYRIKREGFEQTLLKEISLEEMSFTKLTDEQLSDKAQTLVKANHEREILALEKSVKDEIAALNAKKATIEKNAVSLVDKIKSAYEESESKVEKEAALRGFYNSSATVDKIAELEAKKNAEIAATEANKNADVAEIDAKISALNSSLISANKYYSDVHDYEKSAKAAELKDEQEKIEREVFKYNNSVSETLQKSANDVAKNNMQIQLKFMEIQTNYFTKEQLVDMGYYSDVIDCVCAYYDLLEPSDAFSDIVSENKLVLYLEDYYQNIVYMYKMRQ